MKTPATRPRAGDCGSHDLADLRRRIYELEQELTELPGLRARSERLRAIESSPAHRALALRSGALSARRRAGVSWLRRRIKDALGALARPFSRD